MQCPKCDHPRRPGQESCEACGLVFHKYEALQARRETVDDRQVDEAEEEEKLTLRDRLRHLGEDLLRPDDNLREMPWLYAVVWSALVLWLASYFIQGIDSLGRNPGFFHNINLPFHEFGHLAFRPFGEFMGSLGGTLGQLAMPLIAGGVMLFTRADTFGASICLLWFGQNFLDIAPYMADARAGQLPLLGGNYGQSSPYGFHDWEFILGELGLLAWDTTFAAITLNIGRLIMLGAAIWGGLLIYRAWSEQRA
jgi:hypothetical protein